MDLTGYLIALAGGMSLGMIPGVICLLITRRWDRLDQNGRTMRWRD